VVDLTPEHVAGAVGAWAIGTGVWNVNRQLFPEAPELAVGVGLVVAGAAVVEVVAS
jgi:hypothetical protein